MKINEITDDDWLKITDLENMFDISRKQNGEYVYNLNDALYLDFDDSQTDIYVCRQRMHWPLISYNIYGTTRLAWLLMKINKVKPEDMFKPKYPSDVVKYLNLNYVQTIVKNINDYDEY